jgi:cytochrome c553
MRLSDITNEIILNERRFYTDDDIRDIASKYKYIEDFKGNERSATKMARERGLLDDITKGMLSRKVRYTDQDYEDGAKKYFGKPLIDFIKNERNLYDSMKKRKSPEYVNNLLSKMVKQKSSLTDDEIRSLAKNYKYRRDFKNNQPEAYAVAYSRGPFYIDKETGKRKSTYGFYKDITSHMDRLGDKYKRMVYVHEFRDENGKPVAVYVGLTKDEELRKRNHLNPNSYSFSSVKEFIKDNPNLVHKYFVVSDGYIDANDAANMECQYEKHYRDNPEWKVLNRSKCGGLGSGELKYTEDMVRDIASKYTSLGDFIRDNRKLYGAISKSNISLRNEITKHMTRKTKSWSDDEIRDIASKYSVLGDFIKENPTLVTISRNRGIYKDITKHMSRKTNTYTDQDLINVAVNAGSYSNFRKNHPKEYQVAIDKRNLKSEILKSLEKSQLKNEGKLMFQNILKELTCYTKL